jgi:hypothetical protein
MELANRATNCAITDALHKRELEKLAYGNPLSTLNPG